MTTTRDRLALALDVDDLDTALGLVEELRPWFGVAKVGLELFSIAGPRAVEAVRALGVEVFLDVKLHDIPTTVGRASKALGGLGATYLTVHAMGGVAMLEAAVDGLAAGAAAAGFAPPIALAITVLTSDGGAPPHVMPARVAVARQSRCGGVVCAAADVVEAKRIAPDLLAVVPGIRPGGADRHDQARAATPAEAIAAGADLLVIGRAVTRAADRAAAATALTADVTAAVAAVAAAVATVAR